MQTLRIALVALTLAAPTVAGAQTTQGWAGNPRAVGIKSPLDREAERRQQAARKHCAAEKGEAKKACIAKALEPVR